VGQGFGVFLDLREKVFLIVMLLVFLIVMLLVFLIVMLLGWSYPPQVEFFFSFVFDEVKLLSTNKLARHVGCTDGIQA
jgi:Fe2+ transport system protein B